MNSKPKGRNYPFPPRSSALWVRFHVTYDQAVEMFYQQTAMQQFLGNDPLVYSKVYKKVKYNSVVEAQQAHTEQQLEFYLRKEKELLLMESKGIKPFVNWCNAIRSRKNPTESGFANPAERPLTPIGTISSTTTNTNNLQFVESTTHETTKEQGPKSSDDHNKSEHVRFSLGWMQVTEKQSQESLWEELFTSETSPSQKKLIIDSNSHLNEPVLEGEIVVLPTSSPQTESEQSDFRNLIEEATIASYELAKLLDTEVATLNRYFELLSHQLSVRIANDGLPNDYYAQVSTGVGATATLVEQNLTNITRVLEEINTLYVSQVAMASRTGSMNYGTFISQRSELLTKLDGSFAMLSKKSVQLPVYTQLKRNLKLSTKSVVHNADEILKKGYVRNLGRKIGNISIGISAARGIGHVGLLLGAASGMNSIYEACNIDASGDCAKTTTREVAGFMGGWFGGIKGGALGASASTGIVTGIAIVLGVTASAPVLAIAAIGGAIAGGAIGGITGSTLGKAAGDELYFIYQWSME